MASRDMKFDKLPEKESELKLFRKYIANILPYPIGVLYRDALLRKELGEYCSLYELIRITSILLKYIAAISISEYYKYFYEAKISSSEINRTILDYFNEPAAKKAQVVIKSIITEMAERKIPSIVNPDNLLLKVPSASGLLPKMHKKLINLFQHFFIIEKELDSGVFVYIDPYFKNFNKYFNLLDYILFQLLPILELKLCVPVTGFPFNTLAARGISVEPEDIKLHINTRTLETLHLKPVLLIDDKNYISLFPFIYLREIKDWKSESRGSLLFLQKVSEQSMTMLDFVSRRVFEADQLSQELVSVANHIFKNLRENAPREVRISKSPVVDYKDFLGFHQKYFLNREENTARILDFIKNKDRHYGIISGRLGTGKTALMAYMETFLKEHAIVHHFVRQVNGLDEPVIVLRSFISQLMIILDIYQDKKQEIAIDLNVLIEQFNRLLKKAAGLSREQGKRLILILDGIDSSRFPRSLFEILPEELPENTVGLITTQLDKNDKKETLDLRKLNKTHRFEFSPLKGFNIPEIEEYLIKRKIISEADKCKEIIARKIYMATFGGQPLLVRLLVDSILTDQINLEGIFRIEEKPRDIDFNQWKELQYQDDFYRSEIHVPLYYPQSLPGEVVQYFSFKVLGLLVHLQHYISDAELASILRSDIYKVKVYRRLLNKFLIKENNFYSIRHSHLKNVFSYLYSPQDHIRFHSLIINYYEKINRIEGVVRRDCKALSDNALTYLAKHYYQLGHYTDNFQGLWDLEDDDEFRLEQGLRVGVHEVLKSLKLAVHAAVEKNNINYLMQFGFLFNDIERGGVKGGLSMVVSQVLEGNFTEAMDLVRTIPDETFQYKQMLVIAWLLARQDDYINCMEVLDEALVLHGATFSEDDEDLIFKIVETILNLGIAEGLHILKTGLDEERMVRYYSRLADILKDHQDLILRVATGATMELRRLGNEELKGKFIQEFAQIVVSLDDEIKKRQFFENLVFEARNLDDKSISFKTLSSLIKIVNRVDPERAHSLAEDILKELKQLDNYPGLKYKLEAGVAGEIASIGEEDWAREIFQKIIDESASLYSSQDRTEVYQAVAAATTSLADPGAMADYLEQIFALSENLEDPAQQVDVLVGISEVLDTSDEHSALLNIYMETYKYTEELPVDLAAEAVQRIARNMKVVRNIEDYEKIYEIVAGLVDCLSTPDEKSALLKATAQGVASSRYLSASEHYDFFGGLIELAGSIVNNEGELKLGETLGSIGQYVAEFGVEEKSEILRIIFQNTLVINLDEARAMVYKMIGEKLYYFEDSADLEVIIDYLSSVIREIRSPHYRASALAGLVKGVVRIKNKAVREIQIEKLIYLAENFDDGRLAYQVLSSIVGGLLKQGEENWAINLYEKALSLIPLKEEKAPDALGGVMAGLCRGLAKFARKDWAQEIYHKLVRRLEFILPERKRLEVLQGIIDGMSVLEEKELLNAYYLSLVNIINDFKNEYNKVVGYKKLAHAFFDINKYDNSKGMWEKTISIATILDEENYGREKARTLAEAAVNVFKFKEIDYIWLDQAYNALLQSASNLSAYYLFEYIEDVFKYLHKLPSKDSRLRVSESSIELIEKLDNPTDKINCVIAISRGIDNMEKGKLLKQILDRLVNVTKGIKVVSDRVRGMAVLSKNSLNFGMK